MADDDQRRKEAEGIRNMMVSILIRAVRDYVMYRRSTKRRYQKLFIEARDWFFSTASDTEFMSFKFICRTLGCDPNMITSQLDRIDKNELQNIQSRFMS